MSERTERTEITWCTGDQLDAAQLYALLSLRVDVFVVEQECPYVETDGRDLLATTQHGYCTDGEGITAAVRLLGDEDTQRIGRVVTRADARGQGLAAVLVQAAHQRAGASGSALDAQTYLVNWYTNLGWKTSGAEFLEDDIAHTPMHRSSD